MPRKFFDKNDTFELKLTALSLRHKKIARFLQIVIISALFAGFVFSVTGKSIIFGENAQYKNDVVLFINSFSDFFLVSVNALGLLRFACSPFAEELIIFNRSSLKMANANKMANAKSFTFIMLLLRIGPLLPITGQVYFVGIRLGWGWYRYYLPRDFWFFFFNWMICFLVNPIMNVKSCFQNINDSLEEYYLKKKDFDKSKIFYLLPQETNFTKQANVDIANLIRLSDTFNYLCDFLDRFNQSIKSFLVMMVTCITVNLLYICATLIEYGAKTRNVNGTQTGVYIFPIYTLLMLNTAGQAAVMALIGEKLQEEGQRTTSVCYSILNKMRNDITKHHFLNEVNFLLDQSKTRKIYVHAGGFFQINWGILGVIISTVATYSIVIIQFLLK